jgi:phosphoglycerol transferase MdoB-like AlkP superfamily enzyme
LAVAVPFAVFGMRGGMTTATRPITISNANQYVDRPTDAALVLNTPFAIFRTLGKKPFITPRYLSDADAAALYSPVHLPPDSVSFRPMNVVILIVESFGKEYIGSLNTDVAGYRGYTPFIDSLLPECLTFQYSFSNGRKSIDAMPSVLSSIPMFVEPFFLTDASMNDVSSVAGELTRNKGYYSAFFHGAMNGSMGFQAFARTVGFNDYYGRSEYNADPRYHGDRDFDGTWAIWDEEFLQFFGDKLSEFRQPFVTALFTASSHHPYQVPKRYEGHFPAGEKPIHKCIGYTDNALRLFFEKVQREPWFENTLFVLTSDHTNQRTLPRYLTDLGYFCVPIVFYAPGMPELRGLNTELIAEQIDIMPTVLGLLGYDHPYVAFGQDLLHTPAATKFAINYIEGTYQYLTGDLLLQFDGQLKAVYNFRDDPLMQHDIKDLLPEAERIAHTNRIKAIVQQYMERMNGNELVVR